MGNAFAFTQEQKGAIEGAVFFGMAISMFVGGFICDLLGMKRIMFLAFTCHLVGVLATIFAPHSPVSYQWLFTASFLMGCGNGFVETGINPLIATLYPTRKTHYLNILHAWWPGGLILGGLSVKLIRQGIDLGFVYIPGMDVKVADFASWQVSLFLILAPCLVYGAMLVGQRFPLTERVESGVTTGEMFREAVRPAFLLWAFCMLLTAATELGPQKWQESVMTRTAGVSGTMILVYTSGLMFIMRHFAGPLAHSLSPVGMLTGSATLSAIGLYLLSTATNGATAFAFATIYGIGIAYFWPTMLGVTAERFPKGGALLLCLMGSAGNLSIYQVLPQMGRIYDHYAVERIKEEDPRLAGQVVKGEAINQNLAKQIDLLTKLSDEDKKNIDPRSWLTPDQRKKLQELGEGGKNTPLTREQLSKLNLSPEQRLIFRELLRKENGNSATDEGVSPEEFLKNKDLTGTQKDVFQELDAVRGTVSGLQLLGEVEAALLNAEQRYALSNYLDSQGHPEAAEKLRQKDFDPDKLSSRERQAAETALAERKIKLIKEQEQILDKKKKVADAEALGAAMAFRWVSLLPCILVLIFGCIAIYDRLHGGYKAVHIGEAMNKEGTHLG
jgi:fucose permease